MPDASFSFDLAHRGGENLLASVEFALTLADQTTPVTYTWSDVDIPQATRFDESRILSFAAIIRGLSDDLGVYTATRFGWVQGDTDRLVRAWLTDSTKRYFLERNVAIRIITDLQRRASYTPRLVARGLVSHYQLVDARLTRFEGRDFISRFLDDLVPRNVIESARFPDADCDIVGLGEPIILGRVSDQDSSDPVPHGRVPLIPVGTETIGGALHIRLMLAGHAVKEWEQVFLDGLEVVLDGGGADAFFFVPGHANWTASPGNFPTLYRDISDGTTTRRYAMMFVKTGHVDYAAILDGSKRVTANVKGLDSIGNSAGTLLAEYFVEGYLKGFLYNFAFPEQLYQTGNIYTTSPTFDVLDGSLDKIDGTGFVVQRIQTVLAWKIGIVIGAGGERHPLSYWLAQLNFSGGVSSFFNRSFQYGITREGIVGGLGGAQGVDDVNDTIEPFEMHDDTQRIETVVNFSYARDYAGSGWGVGGNRWEATDIIAAYGGRRYDSQSLELWAVQDRDTAEAVMQYRLATHAHPPRIVTIRSGLYLIEDDLGTIRQVTHEDGVGASGYVLQDMQILRQDVLIDEALVVEQVRDLSTILDLTTANVALFRGSYRGELGGGCGGEVDPPPPPPPPPPTGDVVLFDGGSDHASVNGADTAISHYITASTFSWAAWFKPTGAGQSQTYPYNLAGPWSESAFTIGVSRGIHSTHPTRPTSDEIWFFNKGPSLVAAGFTYTPGVWVHIGIRHSGGNLEIFKNGVLQETVASGDTATMSGFLGIMKNWNGAVVDGGALAAMAFWYSALTDADFVDLAACAVPNAISPSTIRAYWLMESLTSVELNQLGDTDRDLVYLDVPTTFVTGPCA